MGAEAGRLRFVLALPMIPAERLVPLARPRSRVGDAVALPDSVFYPEQVSGAYPFTADGQRFWAPGAPWIEPFVGMAAIAASTERVSLLTNVLKATLREPLLVAKSLGSLAAMFPGRIELGVGLSWMPEEYRFLRQDKSTRGARLDELIDIVRSLLAGGFVEFHGAHYDFDRLRMDPVPPPQAQVPIHVGGHSGAAMRRAARRGDGWIGAQTTLADLDGLSRRLALARAEVAEADGCRLEPDDPSFSVMVTPLVAPTPAAMTSVAERGVTHVITAPWYFSGGDPLDELVQVDSVGWFAERVIDPLRK
ncbi:MAG: LLM class flavin-dependent oxidoreductase [Microthrixaceae bacterium]